MIVIVDCSCACCSWWRFACYFFPGLYFFLLIVFDWLAALLQSQLLLLLLSVCLLCALRCAGGCSLLVVAVAVWCGVLVCGVRGRGQLPVVPHLAS